MILDAIFHYFSEEHARSCHSLSVSHGEQRIMWRFIANCKRPFVVSCRIRFDRMAIIRCRFIFLVFDWLQKHSIVT